MRFALIAAALVLGTSCLRADPIRVPADQVGALFNALADKSGNDDVHMGRPRCKTEDEQLRCDYRVGEYGTVYARGRKGDPTSTEYIQFDGDVDAPQRQQLTRVGIDIIAAMSDPTMRPEDSAAIVNRLIDRVVAAQGRRVAQLMNEDTPRLRYSLYLNLDRRLEFGVVAK